MNIEIIAGRGFDSENKADANAAFIVNETAVREFGWDDPVGKQISFGYGETTGEKWEGTVVGVAKDFNTRSLHNIIEPLVIRLQFDEFPGMSLNLRVNGELQETLASIKSTYEKILPGYLMDYRLISEIYENQYQEESKALSALQFGTWVILLISSFGTFSLSLFMSMKRMKEFGIRKVLGATVNEIAVLHIGYFFKIAVMASVVALPVSYWLSEQWLMSFAYRIEPGVLIFIMVMIILIILIVSSSVYSIVKAVRMNPVDVIRME